MRIRTRPLALVAMCLPMAAIAQVCDPEPDRVCPTEPELKYCITIADASCSSGKGGIDIGWTQPPPPAHTHANCRWRGDGRYTCRAWPQDGNVSYAWSVSGALQFVAPPYLDAYAEVMCSPSPNNIVHLTVTSPYGMSTTVTNVLYCGYMGEL
jgi:hypothetical protein